MYLKNVNFNYLYMYNDITEIVYIMFINFKK